MNKLYSKLLLVIFSALAIGGCKVDPVVYPEGTISTIGKTNTGTGTGTGTGSNNGGISNGSTITYTVDGKSTTLTTAFFQVINASQLPPNGSTQIGGGTDAASAFSLSARTTVAGSFDADVIVLGTSFGDGKVTFTEINTTNNGLKGTVKGTFTGSVTNLTNQIKKDISGSFSIKM
ncbi:MULTISPECIES: hypothetical protein [unclassified Mucilaginibacter]|uniref:hypothetical protein n=1 Tax=unclassified Mucilaginibacter TaxID=2617802 RepID=UPI002AC8EFD2|nr:MULTISPECIES: hypothetical protein [unclassified Mucilaginibacter]MEB0263099.1 hypothetical protein [Mucilaginibacter sp. 10I4]MEB0277765.1 hypothetical protein [Mucilaginibacter sp. 10B2]MEB0301913.1 hypothetical protein [Mucilaginibacter sp. 5C4]WPX24610.1 hypothetical protein RHM67_04900 [Mucilaginibacter sp. 5C4]